MSRVPAASAEVPPEEIAADGALIWLHFQCMFCSRFFDCSSVLAAGDDREAKPKKAKKDKKEKKAKDKKKVKYDDVSKGSTKRCVPCGRRCWLCCCALSL